MAGVIRLTAGPEDAPSTANDPENGKALFKKELLKRLSGHHQATKREFIARRVVARRLAQRV